MHIYLNTTLVWHINLYNSTDQYIMWCSSYNKLMPGTEFLWFIWAFLESVHNLQQLQEKHTAINVYWHQPCNTKSTSSLGSFRNHAGGQSVTLLPKHMPVTCLSQARVWLCCVLPLKNSNYSSRLAKGLPLFPLFPLPKNWCSWAAPPSYLDLTLYSRHSVN